MFETHVLDHKSAADHLIYISGTVQIFLIFFNHCICAILDNKLFPCNMIWHDLKKVSHKMLHTNICSISIMLTSIKLKSNHSMLSLFVVLQTPISLPHLKRLG